MWRYCTPSQEGKQIFIHILVRKEDFGYSIQYTENKIDPMPDAEG